MTPGHDCAPEPQADTALGLLLSLIEDYHDFNPDTTVPVQPYPTELQFSQQVARGRPCVYRLDRQVLETEIANEAGANGVSLNDENDDESATGWETTLSLRSLKNTSLEAEQRSILDAPCFKWTRDSLCGLLDGEVEVAVTPDGRADSLYSVRQGMPQSGAADAGPPTHLDQGDTSEQVFLQPATTRMTVSDLIDELCSPNASSTNPQSSPTTPVYYLQSQDSNLSRPELSALKAHLPATPPPFALPTLGDPEATNIWVGNERSVTSTHRDPYENLYLVVNGRKKFVFYAPVEEICLHATMVRTGRWVYAADTGNFSIKMDEETSNGTSSSPSEPPRIPWIPIDPLTPQPPSSDTYLYYKHARPLTVTVKEGEILYLPAGWFHHVTQECGQWEDEEGKLVQAPCIAVNYWFDMDYSGEKHVMREMVGRLVERVRDREKN